MIFNVAALLGKHSMLQQQHLIVGKTEHLESYISLYVVDFFFLLPGTVSHIFSFIEFDVHPRASLTVSNPTFDPKSNLIFTSLDKC